VSPLLGLAGAVGPADLALGPKLHAAVAGRGFEHVAGQITQGVLSGAGGLDINVPRLGPDCFRDLGVEFGRLIFKFLGEHVAKAIPQRLVGQEEFSAGADPGAFIQRESARRNQVMNVGMKDERAGPGVEHAQHPQLRAQAFWVSRQILKSLRTGGKEYVVTDLGMRAHPRAQWIGQREGEQEIGDGQQQPGLLTSQPLVGVGLAAAGTMPVVARVEHVTELAVLRTAKELAAPRGGAAGKDRFQHLALARGHGRAEPLQILRSESTQQVVEAERLGDALLQNGREHERGGALEVAHEVIDEFLVLGVAEAG